MSRNWKRAERARSRVNRCTRLGTNRYLPPFMVNHHVMWLDVPVHDAFGVAVIQSLPDHRVSVTLSNCKVRARTLRSSNM